jgi:hypothetical protein
MIRLQRNSDGDHPSITALARGDEFALWPRTMAFESLLAYARPHLQTAVKRQKTSELSHLVLDGGAGDFYGEEAFRHFLSIERTRADRSGRNFLLLLICLRRCPHTGVSIPHALSGPLFSSVRECVREVDFIGWYQAHKTAGAVLAQGVDVSGPASTRIVHRVTTLLGRRLPPSVADRLRVRVVQLGGRAAL